MKQYVGEPGGRHCSSQVLVVDTETDEKKLLTHHVYHSPDGFAWGYGGSGPSELARCMLWDVLGGDVAPPNLLYHRFKIDFLVDIPRDSGFTIDEEAIWDWLENEGVVR